MNDQETVNLFLSAWYSAPQNLRNLCKVNVVENGMRWTPHGECWTLHLVPVAIRSRRKPFIDWVRMNPSGENLFPVVVWASEVRMAELNDLADQLAEQTELQRIEDEMEGFRLTLLAAAEAEAEAERAAMDEWAAIHPWQDEDDEGKPPVYDSHTYCQHSDYCGCVDSGHGCIHLDDSELRPPGYDDDPEAFQGAML